MAQNYKNSKLQEKLAGLSAKTTNKITEISKKEKDFENQWMQPNVKCWIIQNESDNDPFVPAVIQSYDSLKGVIKYKFIDNNAINDIPEIKILQRGEENEESLDDMVNIECLNDAELLENIKKRLLTKNTIFTYVGPTLLIVNPYKYIDELFNLNALALYQKQINNPTFTLKDAPAHIYSISAELFKNLFELKKNQALVISGESGAGKTENAKYAMKFLTSLGNLTESDYSIKHDMFRPKSGKKIFAIKKEAIEDKILGCNPILEGFGNAKTVRNDNSSRFGKYVTLLINKDTKKIEGAKIFNYLLEKSRINFQASSERNYHVFYHFLKGKDEENLKQNNLIENDKKWVPKDFNYLNQSGCEDVSSLDDVILYNELNDSFKTLHFSPEAIDTIWNLVSGILFLGNLEFDDSQMTDTNPCVIQNTNILKIAASLLKVNSENLCKALVLKTREIAKNVIDSPMNVADCKNSRDTLSKDLYNKLFIWLVLRLNETIIPIENMNASIDKSDLNDSRFAVGLLDIFGFECFKVNSFEQLCINYTNEKLQQLYITYVFKSEENEFIKEGLKDFLCELKFVDNQTIIDLMDQYPMGIFNLLDESCSVAGDDEKLVNKIKQTHTKNPFFISPKINKDSFIIIHTAKDVEYNIKGFREKNRDELGKTLQIVMENSKNPMIVDLFRAEEKEDGGGGNQKKSSSSSKFLSSKFRFQMKNLMNELEKCDCHFIRCLKPNDQKKKDFWMGSLVLQQIKYLGVTDSIRVRKDSYPLRRSYMQFYERYDALDENQKYSFPDLVGQNADFKSFVKKMIGNALPELGAENILYGTTKIFMRNKALIIIEKKFQEKVKTKNICASKIQKAFFRYKGMKKLRAIFKSLKLVQNLWQVRIERKKFLNIKKKIIIIQRWIKNKICKNSISDQRKNIILIQKYIRRYLASRYDHKEIAAKIIKLQRNFKNRIEKMKTIRYKAIKQIFLNNIFELTWNKIACSKAILIQKYIKGIMTRIKHKDIIKKAKAKGNELVCIKATLKIQKNMKMILTKSKYLKMKKSAFFIKGFFKMKWYSTVFKEIKKATITIQKRLIPYFINRRVINERLEKYLNNRNKNFEFLKLQEFSMLYDNFSIDQKYLSKISGNPNYSKSPFVKEIDPYAIKKLELFIYIFDIDLLTDTSEIYPASWSSIYRKIFLENLHFDGDLQYLQIGETHTIAVSNSGKIYSWGWNDYYQLGVPQYKCLFGDEFFVNKNIKSLIQTPIGVNNPRIIVAGDNHTFLLDYDSNVYFWGSIDNLSIVKTPTIMNFFQGKNKIKNIISKGSQTVFLLENGECYFVLDSLGNIKNCFNNKIPISSICCSYQFVMFLGKSGLLYSSGSNNSEGELGHGDKLSRNEPTLINDLTKEKINSVECGYKHVIAKTASNKIFVWGWGKRGQLGNGSLKSEYRPLLLNLLNLSNHGKIVQIQAIFSSTLILFENRKIFWWGTNNTLFKQKNPIEMVFQQKNKNFTNDIDFSPIRILSSWSKTMSILYCTLADTRNSNLASNLKIKPLNILQTKWLKDFPSDINPPYIEAIANHFGGKFMKLTNTKKINQVKPLKKKIKTPKNVYFSNEKEKELDFEEDPFEEQSKSSRDIQEILIENNNDEKKIVNQEENNLLEKNEDIQSKTFESNISFRDDIRNEENFEKEKKFYMKESEILHSNQSFSLSNFEITKKKKNQSQNVFNNEKIKSMKLKINALNQVPKEKWTTSDEEFMKIACNSQMNKLFDKI